MEGRLNRRLADLGPLLLFPCNRTCFFFDYVNYTYSCIYIPKCIRIWHSLASTASACNFEKKEEREENARFTLPEVDRNSNVYIFIYIYARNLGKLSFIYLLFLSPPWTIATCSHGYYGKIVIKNMAEVGR